MASSFVASLGRGRRGDPASWRRMLNNVLCLIVTFVLVTEMLTALGALAGDPNARQRGGLTALIASQAALIVLHVVAAREGATRPTQVAVFTLGAAGLVAAASVGWTGVHGLSAITVDLLPTNAVQAIGLSAVVLVARRLVSLAIIVATGPLYLGLLSIGPREITWVTVDGWITPTGMTLSAAFLTTYLRGRADRAEALGVAAREGRAAAALATNAEQAIDEARRLVHDQVISALRTVHGSPDADEIAHAASTALTALNDLSLTSSAVEFTTALESHRNPRVSVIDEGWPIAPPPKVQGALLDATREALRNAARHGGVDHATVRLAGTPTGEAAIEVHDDGTGFDPSVQKGFGLGQSIEARVRQVGGETAVHSSPGRGSTVTLQWPALRAVPRGIPTQIAEEDRGRLYLWLIAPPMVVNLFLAARYADDHTAISLGVALATAAVLAATALRVGRRPLRATELAGVAIFNTAATWTSLAVASPGALMNLESWIVGFCSNILVVIGFEARARAVLALIAAQTGAVLAFAAHDPTIGVLDPMGAIITPIIVGGLGYVIGRLLRRGTRTLLIAEEVALAQTEEQSWLASRVDARRIHLAHLEQDVEPFLERFAAHRTPSSSDRDRALVLLRQCIDSLNQTQPLPEEFRTAAAVARSRGVTVNVRPDASAEALTLAARVFASTNAAVVTVQPHGVIVMPPLSAGHLGAISSGTVHSDEVRTRFDLRPAGPTTSL